jgi:hypothetical protein
MGSRVVPAVFHWTPEVTQLTVLKSTTQRLQWVTCPSNESQVPAVKGNLTMRCLVFFSPSQRQ